MPMISTGSIVTLIDDPEHREGKVIGIIPAVKPYRPTVLFKIEWGNGIHGLCEPHQISNSKEVEFTLLNQIKRCIAKAHGYEDVIIELNGLLHLRESSFQTDNSLHLFY